MSVTRLLMHLKSESGHSRFNEEFYQWCRHNYGIVDLHEREEYPAVLTGIEIDEAIVTVLRLKYPQAFSGLRVRLNC